jgi:hypothetical protein
MLQIFCIIMTTILINLTIQYSTSHHHILSDLIQKLKITQSGEKNILASRMYN